MTLSIQNLKSGYGKKEILHDVSIPAVQGGIFVGLIGPNAPGKSTLFKTLAGLVTPTAGTITIGTDDVTHLRRKDRARRIAYMP